MRLGGNFVLLGASPIPAIQEEFAALKEFYGNSDQVLIECAYDEALAHQIYAACDFLIVPSQFEPCGLSQMIALRYGTLPIVRDTGGLKDTVLDYENPLVPAGQRNGIVFQNFSIPAVHEALRRAIALWKDETTFQWIVRHGIQQDFGWKKPCSRYLRLYEIASAKAAKITLPAISASDLPKHNPLLSKPHRRPQ